MGEIQEAGGSPGEVHSARFLAAIVAAAFGVCSDRLLGSGRTPEVALARQVAIYLIHTRLGLSLTVAGTAVGRDRTTAAHACRAVELRREDARLDTIIDWLERAVVAGAGGAA